LRCKGENTPEDREFLPCRKDLVLHLPKSVKSSKKKILPKKFFFKKKYIWIIENSEKLKNKLFFTLLYK